VARIVEIEENLRYINLALACLSQAYQCERVKLGEGDVLRELVGSFVLVEISSFKASQV
jgi:hypothetical protein